MAKGNGKENGRAEPSPRRPAGGVKIEGTGVPFPSRPGGSRYLRVRHDDREDAGWQVEGPRRPLIAPKYKLLAPRASLNTAYRLLVEANIDSYPFSFTWKETCPSKENTINTTQTRRFTTNISPHLHQQDSTIFKAKPGTKAIPSDIRVQVLYFCAPQRLRLVVGLHQTSPTTYYVINPLRYQPILPRTFSLAGLNKIKPPGQPGAQ